MPYEIIQQGDQVKIKADGRVGKVIAKGSPTNPSAHFLVRLTKSEVVWFSRDEVQKVS